MPEIPKQYDFGCEDEIYRLWEKSGFFNPDNLSEGEPYSIMMPPPNVTGVLHLGHAFENTLMDITARFQRMRGKKVLILPGTDHAAVATQAKVEKVLTERGIQNPRQTLGREGLLKEIRTYAEESKTIILKQIRKMGTSCDWSRLAYTFDDQRNQAVNQVFKKMYDDGLIYRGKRIVNWDTKLQTTLSDDEIVWEEEKVPFYYFQYGPFVIATARPETKFGDKYVVMHPDDKRYKKYKHGDKFECEWINGKVTATIIKDKAIDPEFGTGVMTITPWHDMIDFEIAQRHHLNGEPIIDFTGKLLPIADEFAGMDILAARPRIAEKLKDKGLLVKVEENYTHRIAKSYRSSASVEPQIKEQWFVDVNKIIPGKKKSLKDLMKEAVTVGHNKKANDKISINPLRFQKVYLNWINNLRDWCISRQIWWGHRIPVYYRKQAMTNDQFPMTNKIPNPKSPKEEIYVGIEAPQEEGWVQDEDTLDTWFSSGLWTFSTLGWPEKTQDLKTFHPTSWMQMGHEILFFWMARMILMSTYALDEIPFKEVYIHGILRNEKGQKFSKSSGNNVDPLDVIEKYGTDALRVSLISGTTPGNDQKFYSEKVEASRNLVTKLWNIFVYANNLDQKFKFEKTIIKSDLKSVSDRWIISRLECLAQEITQDLERANFSLAQEKLRNFTWNELADWYVEIQKIEKNSKVLGYVLDRLVKMWHPFLPFVTEKMWSICGSDKLLMIETWPEGNKKLIDKKAEKEFKKIQEIIYKIRNIRSGYHIEPVKILNAYGEKIKEQGIIERLARIKIVNEISKNKKLLAISVLGFSLKLDIAELINIEKELKSIEKEIQNMTSLIAKSETMLKNKKFIQSAPKEIIEANRIRTQEYKEKLKIQGELRKNLEKLK